MSEKYDRDQLLAWADDAKCAELDEEEAAGKAEDLNIPRYYTPKPTSGLLEEE